MALIECPHCHKTVSDTEAACIHCGSLLKKNAKDPAANLPSAKEPSKNYELLSAKQQSELLSEFHKNNPKYQNLEDKRNCSAYIRVASYCGFVFADLFALIVKLLIFENNPNDVYIESYMNSYVAFIVLTITYFLLSAIIPGFFSIRENRQYLISLKRYQAWLKKDKNIDYVVRFSANKKRDKKYFDNINLSTEKF